MWTLYQLCILLGLPVILLADSNITSHVIGHVILTLDRSPYIAPEGLNITEGSVLEVEAGVTVTFTPGRGVDVYGNLLLKGTDDNKVTFTLPDIDFHPTLTNSPETIKLTGSKEDSGILEVKISDSWQTLCDSRVSDLSRHSDWMTKMSKVRYYILECE